MILLAARGGNLGLEAAGDTARRGHRAIEGVKASGLAARKHAPGKEWVLALRSLQTRS